MAEIKSSDMQAGDSSRPASADLRQDEPHAGSGPARSGIEETAAAYPGSNAMRSAGAIGGGAVGMTHNVLKGAVTATEDVGSSLVGGVAHLAQELVHGVRDVALDATVVVRDGANGLIGAVGEIGSHTVHALTGLLVDVVGGVRQIAGAAMGSQRTNGAATDADSGVHRSEEAWHQTGPQPRQSAGGTVP